jgi:hypothetical protein
MSKAQTPKALPVSSLQYRPRDYFARYDLQAELLTLRRTHHANVCQAAFDGGVD